jgi:hypothetical protein
MKTNSQTAKQPDAKDAEVAQRTQKRKIQVLFSFLRPLRNFCALRVRLFEFIF